jgi:hypothetical protein
MTERTSRRALLAPSTDLTGLPANGVFYFQPAWRLSCAVRPAVRAARWHENSFVRSELAFTKIPRR